MANETVDKHLYIFRETLFLSTRLSCQIAKFNSREMCHFHVPETEVSAKKVTMLREFVPQ